MLALSEFGRDTRIRVLALTPPKFGYNQVRVKLGMLAAIPAVIALAGSAFSGAQQSGMAGAQMQMQQNNANRQLRLAQEQFEMQKRIAEQQQEMARAGSTDARGNRVRYISGVGWVSEPTAKTQGLLNLSDAEEAARLGPDAQRVRRGKQANEGTRIEEGRIADSYRRQLANKTGEVTPEQMQSRMADVMLSEIGEKSNEAKNAIGMQSLRSGTTSNIADDINKLATSGTRTALARARMDAPGAAEQQNQAMRNSLLNSYNLMATRAGNSEDMPFQPTNVENVAAGNMNRSMGTAPYSLAGASGAIGKGAGDASAMMARSYEGFGPAFNAMRGSQINYGGLAGGLGEALERYLRSRDNSSTGSGHEGSHGAGAF